jgi:peroxiredoxin Q/BCP
MIAEGQPAPDLELETDDGRTFRLSQLRGKPVVLYFYPKDDTPGCTVQACGVRDAYDSFRDRGIEVFGISVDDADSHQAFREKYDLPFPLLVDRDRALGTALDIDLIAPDKPFYKRSTVVIAADGTVARSLPDVDPSTHAELVLDAVPAAATLE